MIGLLVAVQDGMALVGDPAPVGGRAVLTALVVVGCVGALAWWLRHRWPQAGRRHGISVETAVSLGDRRSLLVVAVDRRRLLIGATPQHMALLAELDATPGPAFEDTLKASLDAGGNG